MVVLGGRLAADVLEEDARRYFSVYGTYVISVYATLGVSVEDLAQQPPLVRFAVLTLVRAGVLRSSGFRLEPTGRNPQHFTVAWDDLAGGVESGEAGRDAVRGQPTGAGCRPGGSRG